MNILQVGCNNCDDHVFDFIADNKDLINLFVVIDALPDCVSIAKEKYSFLGKKLHPLNCAVSDKNGVLEFFYPQGEDKSAHASLSKSHLIDHRHPILDSFFVPSLNLNCLLDSYKNSIDKLYIDMEGLDTKTLLNLDFEKNKIKYIEYEFYHSDGSFSVGENHNALVEKFYKYNYILSRASEYNIKAELKF